MKYAYDSLRRVTHGILLFNVSHARLYICCHDRTCGVNATSYSQAASCFGKRAWRLLPEWTQHCCKFRFSLSQLLLMIQWCILIESSFQRLACQLCSLYILLQRYFSQYILLYVSRFVRVCVVGTIQTMAPNQKALRSQSNRALFAHWMGMMTTAKSTPRIAAAKSQMRTGLPFRRY